MGLVLATAVWEHLTHPVRCLTNLVQMMAPGGVLVLTVPFMYPYHRVPEDYFRYTPGGMAQVALQSGLKVAHAFGMGTRRDTDALNNGFWVSGFARSMFIVAQSGTNGKTRMASFTPLL